MSVTPISKQFTKAAMKMLRRTQESVRNDAKRAARSHRAQHPKFTKRQMHDSTRAKRARVNQEGM